MGEGEELSSKAISVSAADGGPRTRTSPKLNTATASVSDPIKRCRRRHCRPRRALWCDTRAGAARHPAHSPLKPVESRNSGLCVYRAAAGVRWNQTRRTPLNGRLAAVDTSIVAFFGAVSAVPVRVPHRRRRGPVLAAHVAKNASRSSFVTMAAVILRTGTVSKTIDSDLSRHRVALWLEGGSAAAAAALAGRSCDRTGLPPRRTRLPVGRHAA